jgi:CitMHS family citrate-Mg2+:H+ or citrate-Ca2+:H+ symporter
MFLPMIPAMIGCSMGIMAIAYRLGLNERKRLGKLALRPLRQYSGAHADTTLPESLRDVEAAYAVPPGIPLDSSEGLASLELRDPTGDPAFTAFAGEAPEDIGDRKPQFLWVNLTLTLGLMVALLMDVLPLPALFMIAFAIALMINYRELDQQRERIAAHAPNALAVSGLIFAAGIFTGILSGTKMVDAMANAAISVIPESMGPYMAVVAGLLSIPGTFFISYDAFYFGVMPVVAQAGATYGVDAMEIARASLIGAPVHALSPLTASTYLLIGLAKIELGDHQRFSFKWTLVMAILGLVLLLLTGAVSLVG